MTVTFDAGSTFKVPEAHFRSIIVNAILFDLAYGKEKELLSKK